MLQYYYTVCLLSAQLAPRSRYYTKTYSRSKTFQDPCSLQVYLRGMLTLITFIAL